MPIDAIVSSDMSRTQQTAEPLAALTGLHVQTDAGEHLVESEPPTWTSRFTLPPVYATALAQYAEPSKAFLDALARLDTETVPGAAAVGHPRAGDALAAHRLVDLVYCSAADGGVPKSVS